MKSVDQWMMSAIYWTYSNRTPYQIELSPPPLQGLVYDPALPLEWPNLFIEKFEALVRPYPMSISGTPASWSFDPVSRIFKLEYTSGAEQVSEIFVPNRHYQKGYKVAVTGGLEEHSGQTLLIRVKQAVSG